MASEFLTWLADTTIAVSILIALVLLVRKPFAKVFGARAAYILWLAPLFRLFLPQLNILPAPAADTVAAQPVITIWAAETAGLASTSAPLNLFGFAIAIGVFIWAIVAIAWFGFRLDQQRTFTRLLLASSAPANDVLTARAQNIAATYGIKSRLRLRISEENHGPAVVGLLRPVIVLPANFEQDYTAEEQRLALAHEIAHLARGDMAAMFAANALLAAQWPNPLAHLAARAFRLDQEAACDAFVLARETAHSAKSAYASALIKSARTSANLSAVGLSLSHPVKERLMLIKNPAATKMRQIGGYALAACAITAGLMTTAAYGYAQEEEKRIIKKQVMETEVDGKMQKRIVIMSDDDDVSIESFGEGDYSFATGDGEHKVVRIEKTGDGEGGMHMSRCAAGDGEPEPVKLEWKEESDNGEKVEKGVICVTGEDAADPEKAVAKLKASIDEMEANAKKQEEQRKRMIAGLRAELRKMERENRR